MSTFDQCPERAPDSTFALMDAYKADTYQRKVNLCPGIYLDDTGRTWVLDTVRKARAALVYDETLNHNLTTLLGYPQFNAAAQKITFGETLQGRYVVTMQTISGTGANHFAAALFAQHVTPTPRTVWLSNPTWDNHPKIWSHVSSKIEQRLYPYYNRDNHSLDLEAMLTTLRQHASKGDVIVLQACAHNPTGVDPSKAQWESIAQVCEEKGIFPIIDSAYQGFATGSLADDSVAIRHFMTRSNGKLEFAVAQSFSKNLGLYGERVGALHVVARDCSAAAKVEGALKAISRGEITSAPCFGAKLVTAVYNTPALRDQWNRDMQAMSGRLRDMRKKLHGLLVAKGTPGSWGHFLDEIGMFSMTGLSPEQAKALKDQFHVYIFPNGRLSWTGMTNDNVAHVADAIHQVVTTVR